MSRLEQILRDYKSVLIGYSGGVDSVFLAVTAVDVLGKGNVLAVTGRSASYPDVQWQVARDVAKEFGIPHLEIDTDEMSDPNYIANPTNRCYFCKTELWSKLAPIAVERGLHTVVDGSNADDAHDYRPGAVAAKEHGVRSPLMEAGLTKAEIRALSQSRNLPTWDQPSAPCLSSRLPYGISVTPERLKQIERAEEIIRATGIKDCRVRHHGDDARIEVGPADIETLAANGAEIAREINQLGFARVLLDVDGYRRGALNEGLVQLRPRLEIAVVPGPLKKAREEAAKYRESGFRYVAIDLKVSA